MDEVRQLVVIDGAGGTDEAHAFGAWLTGEMATQRITQQELATRMDVARNAVNRWCNGRIRPNPDTATRIALALNLPPTDALVAAGYMETVDDEREQIANLVRYLPKERLPDALRYLRFLMREGDE